ncbi:MAG: hypothetical protein GTO16_09665 [Candidatus Aminicenantes bacterium]|nr:hypothetical protein [Candidatus Aminicenantes bacterium]
MRRLLVVVFVILVFLVQALQGVVPKKWEVRSKDDFLKGKFDGISVSYDGILSLSPKEEKINGPEEEFYLSLLITPDGTLYLGTGHGGKIYRIRKGEEPEIYFQVPEMDVYCLARDRKGDLYAGTSPNGKIWKITDKGKGDIFFNPREKYIWDLLFVDKGVLLAAVGENGGIYEINSEGEGKLILKAEENHILCIERDTNGDLFAGSGGKGLLYRITKAKKASILFESSYEEIKSIALDREGNIYAAASGTVIKPIKEETPISLKGDTAITVAVSPSTPDTKQVLSLVREQPSALYKIDKQGVAKRLWHSSDELIYSLLWSEREGKLIFGTGDKGRIYSVDKDEKTSLVVQKESELVYLLLPYDSQTYFIANNPPDLSIFFPDQRFSGEYLSQVTDTGTISSWGRIEWEATIPSGATLQFQTRSGNSSNPNETWNNWSPPYQKKQGEQVLNPKARYVQFKVMFKTQSGERSPLLQKVSLFYLQANVAPAIRKLEILPPNEVYLKPPEQEEIIWGADVKVPERAVSKDKEKSLLVAKKAERKGYQTIIWEAEDENGDALLFSCYIKGEDESQWRVLNEKWTDAIYAFDTLSYPDGVYFLKLVVSDIPSNPMGTELKSDRTSSPFIIDNSLPLIKNFKAEIEKNNIKVTFSAEDSLSYITEVKYLIRPDEWQSIFPVDGICDSKWENFSLTLTLPPRFDNLLTVRVKDRHGNIGVYKFTF